MSHQSNRPRTLSLPKLRQPTVSTRYSIIVGGVAVGVKESTGGAAEAVVAIGVIVERAEVVAVGAIVVIEAEETVSVVAVAVADSAAIVDVVMVPHRQVAVDPAPFLSTGLVLPSSAQLLLLHLPRLPKS